MRNSKPNPVFQTGPSWTRIPLLLPFLLLSLLLVTPDIQAAKPNVLLIIADDQGYADFGFMGLRDDVKTPALDQLAKEGTVLTQAYASSAICSPSRMGLISGRYQARFGAFHYGGGRGMSAAEVQQSLPARLRRAGYRTAHFGKHHFVGQQGINPKQHDFPLGLGYDRFYGSTGGRIHFLYHSDEKRREYGHELAVKQMALGTMWNNDQPMDDWEGFTTDDWTAEAIRFIDQKPDQPFFLQMAHNAVHNFAWQLPPAELKKRGLPTLEDLKLSRDLTTQQARAAYEKWYAGVHRRDMPEGRGWYLAQLELMDAAVGRLLAHLKTRGMHENTIVIYTVDNGGCTPDWAENGPLAGGKYHLLEGGTRTPTLIRFPGKVAADRIDKDRLFSSLDIAPTVLEWCGLPFQREEFDGVSQAKALSGKPVPSNHQRVMHWDLGFQWSVREGDWKLMVTVDETKATRVRKFEQVDVRRGVQLYNLGQDPGETTNLAEQNPDIAKRLQLRHTQWRKEMDADGRKKTR